LFYDRPLDEVIHRFADFKLVTVHFNADFVPPAQLSPALGDVLESSPGRLKLKVARHRVISACKSLFEQFPVADLDIQEVSVEEAIRNIFARSDRLRALPADNT